jgi:hypothetical protein
MRLLEKWRKLSLSPNSWSLPNIQHIFYRISDIFAKNRILKTFLRKKIRFLMQGQTKSMYFHEILGLVRQKMVDKLFIQTENGFLPTTDKYSAVFTEYSVAEYSVGHYSAECSFLLVLPGVWLLHTASATAAVALQRPPLVLFFAL